MSLFIALCFISSTFGYLAAIASHTCVPQSDVKSTISYNLDLYASLTKLAKSKNADIIVFPEFGIADSQFFKDRSHALLYSENFPDVNPIKPPNPCQNFSVLPANASVYQTVSCMAKFNSIYLHFNYYDKKPCTGPHCRGTWSLYETDIVFDPNGALIARYHKTHPWFTSLFDTPKPQLVTFKAFGVTFGLMICYDIFWEVPATALVAEGVKHFPYSVSQSIAAPAVVKTWSFVHNATVCWNNLNGNVGVYQGGATLGGQAYSIANSGDQIWVVNVPI